ncbi:valine--tRNA ligase [Candidatus Magnetaquicoccus inordinatus]|uniref:valine--tRNA ligase n=1 Tax=Candidatus Magnetaquicoccus inordinatus TaxID=2496818 RepID=UPI00102CE7AA
MSESSLPKAYDPVGVERRWYAHWEESGYFAAGSKGDRPSYCIMIPPPNVTGTLHMGHAFQDTLMDALIRQRRMRGEHTLWQTGTDHAGIATQMVVERQLAAEGKSRHDLGREEFLKRVWRWKEESGGSIVRQLRRLGASCDWQREAFTMDSHLSAAVQEVFVRLYQEGLIYRGSRLVNWDPVLHTAVSDLEVISEEEEGFLWHLRYPLADGSSSLVVATTRPETMLGDSAVAVHPEDERYQHLIGKEVRLPLAERLIPVIADESVKMDFGSGCVKITPAHDFNDYEVGKRHNLPQINIFTIDATLNEQAPAAYQGMDRYVARKQIIADLEKMGLLVQVVAHRLMIPRGDRSKAVVEPYLTDQWFVRAAPLATEAIRCVEDGRIRFVPDSWKKTYFEWMHNIQDWCISRQIWWGHRIPAWYGSDGSIFVARNKEEAQQQALAHYGQELPLTQDNDVLDTWFSSALWPFSTLGWPEQTPELRAFYPTDVLVTGFDIIFFWVARMIMMGLKFTGDVPFRTVYITGLVRDGEGNKMSKSKGNVLDPLDLIDGIDLEALLEKRTRDLMQPQLAEKIAAATRKEFAQGIPAFGTDALRFTMASLATQGRDIKFDLNRMEGYRNFCNKLWNAARFVLMNTEGQENGALPPDAALSLVDRWILSRLQGLLRTVDDSLSKYRFDETATALYHFLWGEYCDWYLEWVKPRLYGQETLTAEQQQNTRQTMLHVLEQALRLLHPLMPFITEELWQKVAPLSGCPQPIGSLMLASWPQSRSSWHNPELERHIALVQEVVTAVRTLRSENNIPPGQRLSLLVAADPATLEQSFRPYEGLILPLARLTGWQALTDEAPVGCAVAVLASIKLYLPLAGVIDAEAEYARLNKELLRLESDWQRVTGKLNNPAFLANAKAEVVAKEQKKEQELAEKRLGMQEALQRMDELRRQR